MSYQEQTTTDQTVADTRDERLATHPVAETLAMEPDLSRFAELVRRSGLDRILQDGEWITVLAPSNDALSRTGSPGEGEELKRFIRHHVSSGAKTLDDMRRAGALRMKDGSDVPIQVEGLDIWVGGAKIVRRDIECTNGVIHVIDGVI